MIRFTTTIQKFDKQGEKTGWTYIYISTELAGLLNPGVKTSYRVKGFLDDTAVEKMALLPMGNDSFILPLNAATRKKIRKQKGDKIEVELELDAEPMQLNKDLIACLHDEPAALVFFEKLTKGHRQYFSMWIETAKTENTKAKRIAMAVNALARGMGYPQMIRNKKTTLPD